MSNASGLVDLFAGIADPFYLGYDRANREIARMRGFRGVEAPVDWQNLHGAVNLARLSQLLFGRDRMGTRHRPLAHNMHGCYRHQRQTGFACGRAENRKGGEKSCCHGH
jgi:hypothetical protein